jgi:hypothetical protein
MYRKGHQNRIRFYKYPSMGFRTGHLLFIKLNSNVTTMLTSRKNGASEESYPPSTQLWDMSSLSSATSLLSSFSAAPSSELHGGLARE